MLTAVEMSKGVRDGSLRAVGLARAALAALNDDGKRLDAIVTVLDDSAIAAAEAIDAAPGDRPLAGVPIVVKDCLEVQGQPMRIGSLATPDVASERDSPVVARLREAGAVIVALTRVPELCVFGNTDGPGYLTRNPWNPKRSPGGSSGGTAAIVGAGIVPIGHGSDGMGSIRIPSACCGLVGIKPGAGVVPHGDASSWRGLSEHGSLATTVADCALGLSIMAGDLSLANVTEPDSLRISVGTRVPLAGIPLKSHWRSATTLAAEALAGAGHRVSHSSPPYPMWLGPALVATWTGAVADDASGLDATLLQARTRRHAQLGRGLDHTNLASLARREKWRQVAERFFEGCDVLITPALAHDPLEAATWSTRGWGRNFLSSAWYAPFAAPWNLAGWPAMVVPVPGVTPAGTPLSVQLVGRPGSESLLLGVAAALERLRPWPRYAERPQQVRVAE